MFLICNIFVFSFYMALDTSRIIYLKILRIVFRTIEKNWLIQRFDFYSGFLDVLSSFSSRFTGIIIPSFDG